MKNNFGGALSVGMCACILITFNGDGWWFSECTKDCMRLHWLIYMMYVPGTFPNINLFLWPSTFFLNMLASRKHWIAVQELIDKHI